MLLDHSKMAENRKESKENETRWIFRDSMVRINLIEALEASKTEYEGRGLDFEGDLVKLYSQLCKTMLEKYEQTDFGPTAVSEPTKSTEEMSKEEFKEHKKTGVGQQKAISLGYDRIIVQFSESSSRRHSIWKSFTLYSY